MQMLLGALTGWLLRVSLVGTVLCLAYIMYLIFGGFLANPTPQVAGAARYLGAGLSIFPVVLAVCIVARLWYELAYSLLVGLGGALITFGLPILMSMQGVNAQGNPVADSLLKTTSMAGKLVLLVALIRVIAAIAEYVRDAPARQAERQKQLAADGGPAKAQQSISRYGKCWQLPFCHEAIRRVCPAYDTRKTCWKFGRGCNCDPSMIEMMIRQGARKAGVVSADKQRTQQQYMRAELEADGTTPAHERTIPCTKCPIFNEHQRQKFALANPFFVVVTIVLFAMLFPLVMQVYGVTITGLSHFASQFIIQQPGFEIDPGQWFQHLNTPAVKVFFIVIAFSFLFAYVLRVIEWAILVKKW